MAQIAERIWGVQTEQKSTVLKTRIVQIARGSHYAGFSQIWSHILKGYNGNEWTCSHAHSQH